MDYISPSMLLDPITSATTLEGLLDVVGPTVAELAYAPNGDRPRLSSTVIEDPNDALPVTPGAVAILVGLAPDEPAAAQAVQRAARREFSAVVVKRHARDLEPLLGAARSAGIGVIVASDEIPWRHLDALLSTALSSGPGDRDDPGEAEHDQLFSIANAVAAVVGGSVAIEDMAQHVLAYSSVPGQRIDELRRQGILDRRVPRGPRDVELYRRVMSADGLVRFPQMGQDLPRAAVAIRAGSLPLGTLWAIEGVDRMGGKPNAPFSTERDCPPSTCCGPAARLISTGCAAVSCSARCSREPDRPRWRGPGLASGPAIASP